MSAACRKATLHAAACGPGLMALPGSSWTLLLLLCTLEQLGALARHTEAGGPGLEQLGALARHTEAGGPGLEQPGSLARHTEAGGPGLEQPGSLARHTEAGGPGLEQPGSLARHTEAGGPGLEQPGDAVLLAGGRVKRGWVWNQFFVVEEYTGTEPLYVGKIHSDSDEGDGSIKYTISGEGAGTIFLIDELTGDIHATERLDREQKTFYTLRAQARDRQTDQLLEPESEFIIKVQDINDSEPRFLEGPYIGSVAELSPVGTSVMQVMASDADDPTYGSSARVVYSVLDGEQRFTVDRTTGVIRTAVANLDRETQDRYEVVIRATDMAGQLGGLSGSTTVTIVITDVNDNPPRFPQKMYQFSVPESTPVGMVVGRVKAEDSDVGENTDMTYQLRQEGVQLFKVTTDSNTQEAILTVQKPLDYEAQAFHTVVVEALNKFVDPRFVDLGTFRDQTIVRVSVLDVDEPPEFRPPSQLMEVQEDAGVGSVVGVVTALDPDAANSPVRYAIDRSTDLERIFDVDADTGAIVTGQALDRETAGWHNITVLAMEAGARGVPGPGSLPAAGRKPANFSRQPCSGVSSVSAHPNPGRERQPARAGRARRGCGVRGRQAWPADSDPKRGGPGRAAEWPSLLLHAGPRGHQQPPLFSAGHPGQHGRGAHAANGLQPAGAGHLLPPHSGGGQRPPRPEQHRDADHPGVRLRQRRGRPVLQRHRLRRVCSAQPRGPHRPPGLRPHPDRARSPDPDPEAAPQEPAECGGGRGHEGQRHQVQRRGGRGAGHRGLRHVSPAQPL
ncbi:cadherin-22 isoform X2 [Pelodiscus sinensis]|uniref:cadherin-22 isoform X2 n=1 Tax=Pelodiscus sinensis TaxID=13735 RepID=UPI003F6BB849